MDKVGVFELNKIYQGDAYKLIKQIPDKSISAIYVDISYLYETGGQQCMFLR
jgi:DNA modification methylase